MSRKKKKIAEILVINYTTREHKIIRMDEEGIIFNDKLKTYQRLPKKKSTYNNDNSKSKNTFVCLRIWYSI